MRRIIFFSAIAIVLISILYFYYSVKSFKGNEEITLLPNSDVKSFKDITQLKQLENKVVYIDVWGTLCGPCIKEFQFSHQLQQRFKNDPVAFLYLASPYNRADDEFKWKKMIKDKQLTGLHLFLTNELYDNFWTTIKDSITTAYQIPHYLILNKNGKIINANALRPSSTVRLYEQIESALSQ